MMKFKAFISYQHSASAEFARNFEIAIKRYAKPLLSWPIKVFRDEIHLTSGTSLPKLIRDALDSSEFLILLASPQAADSMWVADELEHWCQSTDRVERLIIILTDGTIALDPKTRGIDWDNTTALPSTLRPYLPSIPLYLDMRWCLARTEQQLSNPRYKSDINRVVARLRHIDPNDLVGKEVIEQRRTARIQKVFVSTLVGMGLLAFTALGVSSWLNTNGGQLWLIERDLRKLFAQQRSGALTASTATEFLRVRNAEWSHFLVEAALESGDLVSETKFTNSWALKSAAKIIGYLGDDPNTVHLLEQLEAVIPSVLQYPQARFEALLAIGVAYAEIENHNKASDLVDLAFKSAERIGYAPIKLEAMSQIARAIKDIRINTDAVDFLQAIWTSANLSGNAAGSGLIQAIAETMRPTLPLDAKTTSFLTELERSALQIRNPNQRVQSLIALAKLHNSLGNHASVHSVLSATASSLISISDDYDSIRRDQIFVLAAALPAVKDRGFARFLLNLLFDETRHGVAPTTLARFATAYVTNGFPTRAVILIRDAYGRAIEEPDLDYRLRDLAQISETARHLLPNTEMESLIVEIERLSNQINHSPERSSLLEVMDQQRISLSATAVNQSHGDGSATMNSIQAAATRGLSTLSSSPINLQVSFLTISPVAKKFIELGEQQDASRLLDALRASIEQQPTTSTAFDKVLMLVELARIYCEVSAKEKSIATLERAGEVANRLVPRKGVPGPFANSATLLEAIALGLARHRQWKSARRFAKLISNEETQIVALAKILAISFLRVDDVTAPVFGCGKPVIRQ